MQFEVDLVEQMVGLRVLMMAQKEGVNRAETRKNEQQEESTIAGCRCNVAARLELTSQ